MFAKVVVDWKKMDGTSKNVFRKALLEMRFRDMYETWHDKKFLRKLEEVDALAESYNDEAFDEMFENYIGECLRLRKHPRGIEVEPQDDEEPPF